MAANRRHEQDGVYLIGLIGTRIVAKGLVLWEKSGPVAATVLLHHGLGDGSWHYDWLIARAEGAGPDERVLVSFRVGERIDEAGISGFEATRLADHRAAYLAYEGPVSGGRGVVRRVASGTARIEVERDDELVVVAAFGGVSRVWRGRRVEVGGSPPLGAWRFEG